MNARVVSSQIQPGKTNESVSIYQDSVLPVLKQQKGFKSALYLTDPDTGKALAVSLWETEADMTASWASDYLREQAAKMTEVLAAPGVREHYEVSAQA